MSHHSTLPLPVSILMTSRRRMPSGIKLDRFRLAVRFESGLSRPALAVIPWVTTQCLRSWDSKGSNS